MKQIFLFLLLAVTLNITAQKTYSIEKPLQLNTVNEGAKSDSVLVRGVDKVVKFIPRSEFAGNLSDYVSKQIGSNNNLKGNYVINDSDNDGALTLFSRKIGLGVIMGTTGYTGSNVGSFYNSSEIAGSTIFNMYNLSSNKYSSSIKLESTLFGANIVSYAQANSNNFIGNSYSKEPNIILNHYGDSSPKAISIRNEEIETLGLSKLGSITSIVDKNNAIFQASDIKFTSSDDGSNTMLNRKQLNIGDQNDVLSLTKNQIVITTNSNKNILNLNKTTSGTNTFSFPEKANNYTGVLATTDDISAALSLKANLSSPAFTGIPTAPTANLNTNTTQVATTAFVSAAVSGANSQNVNTYSSQTVNGVKTFADRVVISGTNKYLEFPSGGLVYGAYTLPSIGAYNGYFSIAGSGGSSPPVMIKTPNSATTNLYEFPDASGAIAITLNASATLDFPNTNPGSTSDLTVTVSGAVIGDVVSVGVPAGSVQSNAQYTAFVNATNSVTVRFSNLQASASQDPVSGIFKVKVFK